jgi:hypothetical protein
MDASDTTQQLFDLWRRQMEEGTQAWVRMMSETPGRAPFDPMAFWRPFFDQGMSAWARAMGQGPVSPDLMTQWKRFADEWIELWSRTLSRAMNTEAFAETLGKYLDQWLAAQGPLKKSSEQAAETMLQALNLPSRTQVANVARQLIDLEERIERIEDEIRALPGRLRTGPAAGHAGTG